jgi:hypothetical protein
MIGNYLKLLIIFLVLTSLGGVMACATGGGAVTTSPPMGDYPQSDPEFWRLYGSSRGLG